MNRNEAFRILSETVSCIVLGDGSFIKRRAIVGDKPNFVFMGKKTFMFDDAKSVIDFASTFSNINEWEVK